MRKSSYVEVRDTRLYIERIGEGYPIIILHGGFGFDMRFFDDCLDPLGEYFELIYVDLRGQGLSDEVSLETITFDNMALDVVELAKVLGVKEYAVFGHSAGAMLVLQLIVNHPGSASHIITMNGLPNFEGRNKFIEKVIEDFKDGEIKTKYFKGMQIVGEVYEEYQTDKEKAQKKFKKAYHEMASMCCLKSTEEVLIKFKQCIDNSIINLDVVYQVNGKIFAQFDVESQLKNVKEPVLIITGELENNCDPKRSIDMHNLLPNSELHLMKDVGHFLFIQKPKELINIIYDFMKK